MAASKEKGRLFEAAFVIDALLHFMVPNDSLGKPLSPLGLATMPCLGFW